MRTIQLRRRFTCLRRVKLSMARLLLPLGEYKAHPASAAAWGARRNLLAYARHWLHTPRVEFSF